MFSQFQAQRSLCGALRDRQLFGTKILARPFLADFQSEEQGGGCILNNPGLIGSPAFACEYSKVYNGGKFLAVADEEGFISIMDTATALPRSTADDDEPKPRAQWLAHKNAVFDVAWAKDDSWMLAASGDQTISLWDTGLAEPLGSFRAHTGSVKSVCPQPGCSDVFASGARDGVLMVWDARVPAVAEGPGEAFHKPVVTVQDAHALDEKKRRSKVRAPLQGRTKPSVTSVLFADGATLATGGVDGILKLWDLRYTAAPTTQQSAGDALGRLCSVSLPSVGIKQHGITSLALHPNGVELLVSLTGGHHLMYQLHRPHIGPTKLFGGHTVASFYVKAAFSPDGSHIVSGSTDRKVYIWQVDGGEGSQPYTLAGHEGEVTAVAWCASDLEQIATTADDATVRVWTVKRRDHGVKEVADPPRQLLAWQELGLGLASPALPSPASRRSSGAAAALSQPTTPQVPSARRTPSMLRLPHTTAAAAAAAAGRLDENGRGNLQQPQQQQQQGSNMAVLTPGGTVPGSPSGPAYSVRRPASVGTRRPRSMAELHAVLGSQQKLKKTKQQSIAPFLSPPTQPLATLPGRPAAGPQAAAAGEGPGSSGAGTAGACPDSSPAAPNRHRQMPLSPRLHKLEVQMSPNGRAKRLCISFELPPGFAGSAEAGGSAAAVRRRAGASLSGALEAQEGHGGDSNAAAAASQLEPSPTNMASALQSCFVGAAEPSGQQAGMGAAAGGPATAGGELAACDPSMHRKGSMDGNAVRNPKPAS